MILIFSCQPDWGISTHSICTFVASSAAMTQAFWEAAFSVLLCGTAMVKVSFSFKMGSPCALKLLSVFPPASAWACACVSGFGSPCTSPDVPALPAHPARVLPRSTALTKMAPVFVIVFLFKTIPPINILTSAAFPNPYQTPSVRRLFGRCL